MLTISAQVVAALTADQAAQRPARFQGWWMQHGALLGTQDAFRAQAIFHQYHSEVGFFELIEEDRIFLFVAARFMMPDMDGLKLLAVLDMIFSDTPEDERLLALCRLAREARADG